MGGSRFRVLLGLRVRVNPQAFGCPWCDRALGNGTVGSPSGGSRTRFPRSFDTDARTVGESRERSRPPSILAGVALSGSHALALAGNPERRAHPARGRRYDVIVSVGECWHAARVVIAGCVFRTITSYHDMLSCSRGPYRARVTVMRASCSWTRFHPDRAERASLWTRLN